MSGATVTEKHRELAQAVFRTPHQFMSQNDDEDLAQAIADAEARGQAKEREAWTTRQRILESLRISYGNTAVQCVKCGRMMSVWDCCGDCRGVI
jgi:hypothetical protein